MLILHGCGRCQCWPMPVDLPQHFGYIIFKREKQWKDGRAVEGGGLENRYTVLNGIEGSNPSPSATY